MVKKTNVNKKTSALNKSVHLDRKIRSAVWFYDWIAPELATFYDFWQKSFIIM